MSIQNRIIAVIFSLFLIFIVYILVHKRKLRIEYSLLWFAASFSVLFLSIFDKALELIMQLLGAEVKISVIYFIGLIYLVLLNLHFSVKISKIKEDLKTLSQEYALLHEKIMSK